MIKETDLRIGNVIYYQSSEDGLLPNRIDWQDLKWLSENPESFNETFKPIPINWVVLGILGWWVEDNGDHAFLQKQVGEWGIFISNEKDEEISISSMGDSRLYGVSNQYIFQYTEDDIIPNHKNAITKSLGMLKLMDTDFVQKDILAKESRYLLSTDGFYNLMEKNIQKFYDIFNFTKLVNAKKTLRKNIIGNNSDDATYILIETHV